MKRKTRKSIYHPSNEDYCYVHAVLKQQLYDGLLGQHLKADRNANNKQSNSMSERSK